MSTKKNYRPLLFAELKKLNREGLRLLCFLLSESFSDLRYDNLRGETFDNQVQALIEYLEQRETQDSWGQLKQILAEHFTQVDASFLEAIGLKRRTGAVELVREALRTGRRADVLAAWRLFQARISIPEAGVEGIWLACLVNIVERLDWSAVLAPAQLPILHQCQHEWTDELVGALLAGEILAADEGAKKIEVMTFLSDIPLSLLRDESLEARFAEARTLLLGRLQSRLEKWPVLRPLNLRLSTDETAFWLPRAEEEYESLFGKADYFWPGHPLYQLLDGEKRGLHQVVVEEEGCGRTAMAQALYAQQSKSGIFTVYVDHAKSLEHIVGEMVHHLWQYVLHKPLLLPFHKKEYRLLANVLSSGGVRHGSLAVRQAVRYEQWLGGVRDEQQKKVWRDIGRANLERLQNAFEGEFFSQWMDDRAGWLVDYAQAVELVCGYSPLATVRVRLVLDLNEIGSDLVEELAENGREWQRVGLQIFLFLPTTQYAPKLLPWQNHKLTWTDRQIKQLIGYRLAKFWQLPKRVTNPLARADASLHWYWLEDYFELEAINKLVELVQGSPQLAARLCAMLSLRQNQDKMITLREVNDAKSALM